VLLNEALMRFGRLDGVVANAGLLRSGPLVKISAEDFELVHAVHVRGTFLLLQTASRYWRAEAKAGRSVAAAAVTTTSSAGLYGFVGEAAYSAAKAAVAAMTIVAAEELGRYGVTVNAVAPVARTRLTAWMGKAEAAREDPYDPASVAPVVAWLLSDRARGVTGRVFEVGGGRLSVADGWRPGAAMDMPRQSSIREVDALVDQMLVAVPASEPVQRADPALVTAPAST
jgi:NAD(P)-dependent dehydrogenase (short-subunit alcohol dehydrogenase family)